MAKVSLKEKLLSLLTVELFFTGLSVEKTKDGGMVAVLQLAEPIDFVRGSQELQYGDKLIPITASDVTEIKIHEDDIDLVGDDFQFDQDSDEGFYKGDKLVLDVSKAKQVWLRSQTFRASGNEMRATNRNERTKKILGIIEGAEAKASGKPTPVDMNATGG